MRGEEGRKEEKSPPIEVNRWTDRVNERQRWRGKKGVPFAIPVPYIFQDHKA